MVGGVEPAAPEPVEVHARSLFHGAEEISGCRTAETPATRIFLEREVEELAAQDRLAQDRQCDGRLCVGVGAKLQHAVGLRHDRHLKIGTHVVNDVVRLHLPGNVGVPLATGQGVEKAVEALIHPGPLALVRVHGHREIDVPDLVDDDAHEVALLGQAVGARAVVLQVRARAVERDHRVFHAAHGPVDRLRGRVGVVERVARVHFHRVDHGRRRVVRPHRLAFLGVEAHGHDQRLHRAALLVALRVPDELA